MGIRSMTPTPYWFLVGGNVASAYAPTSVNTTDGVWLIRLTDACMPIAKLPVAIVLND
jgi:hypothetical protein